MWSRRIQREISIDSNTCLFVMVLVILDQPQLRCGEQIGISSQAVVVVVVMVMVDDGWMDVVVLACG